MFYLFFRRKILWTRMPAHCHSLHLPHINEPSLDVHYILPLRQRCQKSQPCEGIDNVLLKGPKFKIQFWKTKKGSLIGDVQRLIFSMISHARNWPTIKIYSHWLNGLNFTMHLCIIQFSYQLSTWHQKLTMLWFYFNSVWVTDSDH